MEEMQTLTAALFNRILDMIAELIILKTKDKEAAQIVLDQKIKD